MRPRKVLYLSPNSELGGAEQLTFLLAKHHRRDRWEPEFCFLGDGPLVTQVRAAGMGLHILPGPRPRLRQPWALASAAREISRILLARDADLLHSVMTWGHLLGAPAARIAGRPEVWFQHGPVGPLDWLAARLRTRALFVNSEYTRRREASFWPSSAAIERIHCGIEETDFSSWEKEAAAFRARQGVTGPGPVFGIMGRLSPLKGHEVFLRAAGEIFRSQPEARFLVIGGAFLPSDRAYEERIRAQASRSGLGDVVRFTGSVKYPQYAALAACDVIVNASVTPEAFGLTLAEGMMLGKAVIAPDAGGPAEFIRDGVNGLLFPSGDPAALAERMTRLLSPDLRGSLGERAAQDARTDFSVARMVEEVESVYARACGG